MMINMWKCPNCRWIHAEVPEEEVKATLIQAVKEAVCKNEHDCSKNSYFTCWTKDCGTPSSKSVPALVMLQPIVIPKSKWQPS